jgi:hypothetical protein
MSEEAIIAKIQKVAPNPGPVFLTYKLLKSKAPKELFPSRWTVRRHKNYLKKAGLL